MRNRSVEINERQMLVSDAEASVIVTLRDTGVIVVSGERLGAEGYMRNMCVNCQAGKLVVDLEAMNRARPTEFVYGRCQVANIRKAICLYPHE